MIDLPGPQFEPRPGWGGQLHKWYVDNVYGIIFRLILLCILVIMGVAFILHREHSTAPIAEQQKIEIQPITLSALRGDGITHVAARALDLYIAIQPVDIKLDAAQHLYVIDILAHQSGWRWLHDGEIVSFTPETLDTAINAAINLSQQQHSAWQRFVR